MVLGGGREREREGERCREEGEEKKRREVSRRAGRLGWWYAREYEGEGSLSPYGWCNDCPGRGKSKRRRRRLEEKEEKRATLTQVCI